MTARIHPCLAAIAAVALLSACSGAVEDGAQPVPGCAADSQCSQGFFCVQGACQRVPATCASTSECSGTDACLYSHCVAGCATTGCGAGLSCDSVSRVCIPGAPDAGSGAPDAGNGAPDAGNGAPDAGVPDAGVPDAGPAVTNGDFESGTLAGWTATGQTSVSTDSHTGSHSAMVGSRSPSTSSAISQRVVLPAGNPKLSFWFKVVCPDLVQYDYASAAVMGANGQVLATVLAPTCTNTNTWVQGSADLSAFAGQPATLIFGNHDDNNAGDPTYTLFDDVQIAQGSPSGPDFSLAASPGNVTGTGSAVIAASGSGGFASSISLALSGAPAGASAALSATSIAAGSSATLSLAPGSAAAGSYTLLVSGSSGGHTRSTSVAWTIPGAGPSPDFSVSASPSSVTGAGSTSIGVAGQNGFSATVSLSVAGAPAGATASLSSSSVGGGSGNVSLSLTPGSAASGTYSLHVTATSGALSHSATVAWTIAGACTADTWGNYAATAFSNNCVYCHNWAGSYSSVKADASACSSRISSGNMPQDHALSADDKSRLLKWLSCGLPQ